MMIGAIEPRGKLGYTYEIWSAKTRGEFGRTKVWQVVRVDTTTPFPTRVNISEHNSQAAAERARAAIT